jgi:hypothetical protein
MFATRKRRLVGAVIFAVAGIPVAFMLWPLPPSRVTKTNFDRIWLVTDRWSGERIEGVDREAVEAVLGPPGDYRTGPRLTPIRSSTQRTFNSTYPTWFRVHSFPPVPPLTCLIWQSDTLDIYVFVDASGQVHDKHWVDAMPAEYDDIDYLLWRTKHQWRRLIGAFGY